MLGNRRETRGRLNARARSGEDHEMTGSVEDEPRFEGGLDQSIVVDKKPWRHSAVAALVISVVVLWLGWLLMWENNHPAASAARGTQRATAAERLKAVHELEGTGPGDPEVAVPALIACLKDSDAEIRAAAAMAMISATSNVHASSDGAKIAREAVSALRESLKDSDAAVRANSAKALWAVTLIWSGPRQAVDVDGASESLVAAMKDRDADVRLAAIGGLDAIAPKASTMPLEALVASLGDESEKNRAAAARALLRFHKDRFRAIPMVVRSLEKARPPFRSGYVAFLKGISPPPRETAGATSAAQERAFLTRTSAPEFSAETVSLLTAALESSDREARFWVASALAEFRDVAETAIPSLIKSLNEEGARKSDVSTGETAPDPATAVALALGKIAPESATPVASANALIKLLRSENRERRLAAANALGRFKYDATIVRELTKSASDRDAAVRAAALTGVHDIGHLRRIPADPAPLAAALEDESPLVRVKAAWALGHVSSAVDPYIAALVRHADHDTDAGVREACIGELFRLRPPAVSAAAVMDLVPWLEGQDGWRRRVACEILSGLGPAASQAVPALIRGLNEPDRIRDVDDRRMFAEVLGRIGPAASDAVLDLVRVLRNARTGKQTFAAVTIAAALGKIAPKHATSGEAIAVLVDNLDLPPGQSTCIDAAEAIGHFGPAAVVAVPRLVELLKEATDNENLSILLRENAAQSLGLIAPDTDQADRVVAALIDALEKQPNRVGVKAVIRSMAQFGPKAAGAIPILRSLLTEHKIDAETTATAEKVLAELEKASEQPPGATR
jgi:HEAT repeat protein